MGYLIFRQYPPLEDLCQYFITFRSQKLTDFISKDSAFKFDILNKMVAEVLPFYATKIHRIKSISVIVILSQENV